MTQTVSPTAGAQLIDWMSQLDEVIDELHDDLVRRAIVHLQSLRDQLQAAADVSA